MMYIGESMAYRSCCFIIFSMILSNLWLTDLGKFHTWVADNCATHLIICHDRLGSPPYIHQTPLELLCLVGSASRCSLNTIDLFPLHVRKAQKGQEKQKLVTRGFSQFIVTSVARWRPVIVIGGWSLAVIIITIVINYGSIGYHQYCVYHHRHHCHE
jgi:hypothetical protein